VRKEKNLRKRYSINIALKICYYYFNNYKRMESEFSPGSTPEIHQSIPTEQKATENPTVNKPISQGRNRTFSPVGWKERIKRTGAAIAVLSVLSTPGRRKRKHTQVAHQLHSSTYQNFIICEPFTKVQYSIKVT
jgi:hypothetical protein